MRLIRFECQDRTGKWWGLFNAGFDMPEEADRRLSRELGSRLNVPDPYPDGTKAYFTLCGLQRHMELLKLQYRCRVMPKVRALKIRLSDDDPRFAYKDEDQVLLFD